MVKNKFVIVGTNSKGEVAVDVPPVEVGSLGHHQLHALVHAQALLLQPFNRDDIFGPVREIIADYSGVIYALNCTKINLNGFPNIT
jgi:hypothetical protein